MPKDTPRQIKLVAKEGLLREEMGEYDEAIRWYRRGLRSVDSLPKGSERDRLRLELSTYLAFTHYREGNFEECLRRCNEVVELALEVDDLERLGDVYLTLHIVHTQIGSPERVAFRGLALPIFEELGNLRRQATVLNNLGIDYYYEGDWTRSLDVYELSRVLFERTGDVTSVAMAMNNIAEILSDQGQLDEAQRLFEEVRETADQAGNRFLALLARLNLGRAAARAGRFDEADALLAEALEGFHEIHAASFEQETHARIAEAAVLAGGGERALREADVAELVGESNAPPLLLAILHRVRGCAHLLAGRPKEAAAELDRSLEEARAIGALHEVAFSLQVRSLLPGHEADTAEAQGLFDALKIERVAELPLG